MHSEKDSSEQDMKIDRNTGFIEYVFTLDADNLSEMLAFRAIPSMIHSIRRHGICDFSNSFVRLWTVDMLLEGLKGSTVKRYIGAVHTLYKDWVAKSGSSYDESVFTLSLSGFDTDASAQRLKDTDNNLIAAERFVKVSVKQDSPAFLYSKAFQYLLFNPFASLRDIVNMKFADTRPDCLHLEDIVTSMRNAPQAKYVFPLQQGKRRENAIV
ncbi:MAG: hypothetical protein K2K23_04715, partial [Muribaculaceae bacterium]|nr:hypothetical protein [Muribaculaceae bacterium]